MPGDADAIVVGSGPNGLAAAVTLAAAGLRVHVIEGAASPGGGCRTEELTLPGFRHDVCSAAHPLALASPFFRRFDPAARGVRFAHPEVVYAHPLDGGRAAVVTRSVTDTAARLGRDETAYRRLMQPLADGGNAVADAVLSSMRRPPGYSGVPAALALAAYARLGLRSAAAVARRFQTEEARGLFAGVATHAMLPLTAPPTAGVGLLLGSLAHTVGWPVVAGGSARLTDAMVEAIVAAGGQVETGHWVRSLAELPAAPAVLLDISPRAFLTMAGERLPSRYRDELARFRYGPASARSTSPCPARCRGRTRERGGPGPCTSAAGSRRSPRPRPRWPAASTRIRRTCSWSRRASPTRPGRPAASTHCGPTAMSLPGRQWT